MLISNNEIESRVYLLQYIGFLRPPKMYVCLCRMNQQVLIFFEVKMGELDLKNSVKGLRFSL
jgi:hypothetical protein